MSIEFSKTIEYETGETLFFRYEGLSPSVDMTTKKTEQVKKFMSDNNHNGIYRDVVYLKTILKDLNEKLFIISYTDVLGNQEELKYKDGELLSYKLKKLVDSMMIEMEKNATAEFKITFKNPKDDFIEYGNSKIINKYVDEALLNISSLKKLKTINVKDDAKKLIDIYKEYYGETPDFSDKNDRFNTHLMMNILESFGITLGDDEKYHYNTLFGEDTPVALGIETIILTLQPLGKIIITDSENSLSEDERKVIKKVSDCIRTISKTEDINSLNRDFFIEKNYGNDNTKEIETSVKKVKSTKELFNNRI